MNKIKTVLLQEAVLQSDETGININGSQHWLHCVASGSRTRFYADKKRVKEATDEALNLLFSGHLPNVFAKYGE